MKYYAPENASFLFPFQFDPVSLQNDLKKCKGYDFLANYVPENYIGKDYILPLRSIEGRLDFPVAVPNSAEQFKDTIALEQCAYFKEVINTFLCKKEAIRLMNLPAGRSINTHTDHDCGYEDGIFRVHVPIITNKEVRFTLNNQDLMMRSGEAWYTNVNLPHSVTNKGQTNRIHLVIDCIRNEWSDILFASLGYDFEQEKEAEEKLSNNEIAQIIKELELQNSPASKLLITQLKDKLTI